MQRSLFSSYYTTEAEGEAAYDTSFLDDIIIVEDESGGGAGMNVRGSCKSAEANIKSKV